MIYVRCFLCGLNLIHMNWSHIGSISSGTNWSCGLNLISCKLIWHVRNLILHRLNSYGLNLISHKFILHLLNLVYARWDSATKVSLHSLMLLKYLQYYIILTMILSNQVKSQLWRPVSLYIFKFLQICILSDEIVFLWRRSVEENNVT